MKTYKVSIFIKYFEVFRKFAMDWFFAFLLPFLVIFSNYVSNENGFLIIIIMTVFVIIMHYKIDRTYYPFLAELYKDKVHLRYYDSMLLRPFFMTKFVDVTLCFKDIKDIKFGNEIFHGTVYFYLEDRSYYITSISGSTVQRFYQDLNKALEEYRKNENMDKS